MAKRIQKQIKIESIDFTPAFGAIYDKHYLVKMVDESLFNGKCGSLKTNDIVYCKEVQFEDVPFRLDLFHVFETMDRTYIGKVKSKVEAHLILEFLNPEYKDVLIRECVICRIFESVSTQRNLGEEFQEEFELMEA